MECPTNTSSSPQAIALQIFKSASWLEYALILAIITLLTQVFSSEVLDWWHLPSPGKVGIDRFPREFYEEEQSRSISPQYVCSLPSNYSKADKWPLVVYLHGSGERGHNPQTLVQWVEFLSAKISEEYPTIVLVPQCASQQSWQPADLRDVVEVFCRRYQIDRDRIYLVGFSMGGFGTWKTASVYPDLFAAIVPISGGGDTKNAPALFNVPIWAFHGEKDNVVIVENTINLVEAIRTKGGEPKLTLFPTAGHAIPGKVCNKSDLWQWLFAQRLSHRSIGDRLEHGSKWEPEH